MKVSTAKYLKIFLVLQFFFYAAGGRVSDSKEIIGFPKQIKTNKEELKSNTVSEEPSDNETHKKRRYKPKGTEVSIPSVYIGEIKSFFITNEFHLDGFSDDIILLFYYSPGKRGPLREFFFN